MNDLRAQREQSDCQFKEHLAEHVCGQVDPDTQVDVKTYHGQQVYQLRHHRRVDSSNIVGSRKQVLVRWRENWKLSACAKQALCFVVENEKKSC